MPEPLAAEARHWENSPVNEDAEFGVVIPRRQWTGVQGFPRRLVARARADDNRQEQEDTDTESHVRSRSVVQRRRGLSATYPIHSRVKSRLVFVVSVTWWRDNQAVRVTDSIDTLYL